MQIEIYADVVFLINLFMDFFILWITARLCKKKILWIRMILGSAVASILYCFFIFVYPFSVYLNIFSAVLLLALGIFIALKPKNIRELFKYILIAHISAFAVGGAGIALFYFTNIGNALGNLVSFTVSNFSVKILLASTCFSYIVIKLGFNRLNKSLMNKKTFYMMNIFFDGNNVELRGLVDTGNTLNEPITDAPVIICTFNAISKLLPDSVRLLFYERREDDLLSVLSEISNTSFYSKIRMIPYSSVGKSNGMLIGFKPDKVEISDEKNKLDVEEVIIGIYNGELSKLEDYNALINPMALKNNS